MMPTTVMVLRLVQPGPSEFTTNHLDVILGCDGTPFFMKRILLSPVTHFNVLLVGTLIIIGVMHNHAHHTMEHDIHGVVRKYCRANPGECAEYLPEDWLK